MTDPANTGGLGFSNVPDYGDPDSVGFWNWCQRRQLRIQQCDRCGHFIHFPAPICPRCLSAKTHWAEVSGRGRIYAMTIVHHAISEVFKSRIPYAVAWIELEEQYGLRLLTNVVDCDVHALRIDMPVEIKFVRSRTGLILPTFAPASAPK